MSCCSSDPPPKSARDQEDEDRYNREYLAENKDSLKNGPIAKRSITDCFCCLLFIAAIVGFCGASAYGWSNGDPSKLTIGWDSDGNGCGWSDATKDYPYLYWPESPLESMKDAIEAFDLDGVIELLNKGVCVKECPDAVVGTTVDCKLTTDILADSTFNGCI